MMRVFILLTLLLAGISSCEVDDPEIGELKNFKLTKMDGKVLHGSFDVDVTNPNFFGVKLKKCGLDITANNQPMGVVHLDDKIKIKRKSEKTYTVPVVIDLADGALFRVIKLAGSKTVEIGINGKVKGSVFLIGKTLEIHETKTIDGSQLKLPEKS